MDGLHKVLKIVHSIFCVPWINHPDELIKDVVLGGLYTIIGIPIYQLCGASANIDISIEVHILSHTITDVQ